MKGVDRDELIIDEHAQNTISFIIHYPIIQIQRSNRKMNLSPDKRV